MSAELPKTDQNPHPNQKPKHRAVVFLDEWGPRIRNWWAVFLFLAMASWPFTAWLYGLIIYYPEFVTVYSLLAFHLLVLWKLLIPAMLAASPMLDALNKPQFANLFRPAVRPIFRAMVIHHVLFIVAIAGVIISTNRAYEQRTLTAIGSCIPWYTLFYMNTIGIIVLFMLTIMVLCRWLTRPKPETDKEDGIIDAEFHPAPAIERDPID